MVKSPAKKKPGHPDFSGGVNSAKSSIIPEGNYCLQAPRPRPLLRLFLRRGSNKGHRKRWFHGRYNMIELLLIGFINHYKPI